MQPEVKSKSGHDVAPTENESPGDEKQTRASGDAVADYLPKLAPVIFVLLWSTGFIGAKLGLPFAEPFTFLGLRMAIVLAILLPIVLAFAAIPKREAFFHSMVAGVLIHAIYLGGVFFAISRGMPAGISALVVSLQPVVTAFVAYAMLGEQPHRAQLLGLALGLVGVGMVLYSGISAVGANDSAFDWINLTAVTASVVAISVGTVYQKRFASGIDIRGATFAQYAGALLPLALLSVLFESRQIVWSGEFIFALTWLVVVLSIGAVGLLMLLIRLNSVSSVASLFYLVPAVTAVIANLLFGETLSMIQLFGMAVVIVAVALATRQRTRPPA